MQQPTGRITAQTDCRPPSGRAALLAIAAQPAATDKTGQLTVSSAALARARVRWRSTEHGWLYDRPGRTEPIDQYYQSPADGRTAGCGRQTDKASRAPKQTTATSALASSLVSTDQPTNRPTDRLTDRQLDNSSLSTAALSYVRRPRRRHDPW
jgi:hypothetical protein